MERSLVIDQGVPVVVVALELAGFGALARPLAVDDRRETAAGAAA